MQILKFKPRLECDDSFNIVIMVHNKADNTMGKLTRYKYSGANKIIIGRLAGYTQITMAWKKAYLPWAL